MYGRHLLSLCNACFWGQLLVSASYDPILQMSLDLASWIRPISGIPPQNQICDIQPFSTNSQHIFNKSSKNCCYVLTFRSRRHYIFRFSIHLPVCLCVQRGCWAISGAHMEGTACKLVCVIIFRTYWRLVMVSIYSYFWCKFDLLKRVELRFLGIFWTMHGKIISCM